MIQRTEPLQESASPSVAQVWEKDVFTTVSQSLVRMIEESADEAEKELEGALEGLPNLHIMITMEKFSRIVELDITAVLPHIPDHLHGEASPDPGCTGMTVILPSGCFIMTWLPRCLTTLKPIFVKALMTFLAGVGLKLIMKTRFGLQWTSFKGTSGNGRPRTRSSPRFLRSRGIVRQLP